MLGLETGIDGGSVSILENDVQIDFESGSGGLSKSEDMLFLLEKMLERNSINKREIGLISVSDEPGSLTGLRIGISIARGLSDALSVPIRKVSILHALATLAETDGLLVSAILTEKRGVYFREYIRKTSELQLRGLIVNIKGIPEFLSELEKYKSENENLGLVFNADSAALRGLEGWGRKEDFCMYPVEGNPAEILGKAATRNVRLIT